MTLTVAQPKRDRNLTEGRCCAFCCAPPAWLDPFTSIIQTASPSTSRLRARVSAPFENLRSFTSVPVPSSQRTFIANSAVFHRSDGRLTSASVPVHQSELFYQALKKRGVDATFYVVKGGGHGFRDAQRDTSEDLRNMAIDFFDKQFGIQRNQENQNRQSDQYRRCPTHKHKLERRE